MANPYLKEYREQAAVEDVRVEVAREHEPLPIAGTLLASLMVMVCLVLPLALFLSSRRTEKGQGPHV